MSKSSPNILLVIAHPDDEAFVAGTLCLCHEYGFDTNIICVTSGEGGDHPFLDDGDKMRLLKRIRQLELELSALSLGVSRVELLGFENAKWDDPNLGRSWDEDKLAETLANAFERYCPDLIMTHGPGGGYGHPEHKRLYSAVMSAVSRSKFCHSVFSFCAAVDNGGYFPQWYEGTRDVEIDVRGFHRRRVASLRYYQSQWDWFLRRPRRIASRRFAAALFGRVFAFTAAGRRRIAFTSPEQLIEKMTLEGFALQQSPKGGAAHFFEKYFAGDRRVRLRSR